MRDSNVFYLINDRPMQAVSSSNTFIFFEDATGDYDDGDEVSREEYQEALIDELIWAFDSNLSAEDVLEALKNKACAVESARQLLTSMEASADAD